jgi:hypothetical protein
MTLSRTPPHVTIRSKKLMVIYALPYIRRASGSAAIAER